MERAVMWVPREGPGPEHLRLTLHGGATRADGVIIPEGFTDELLVDGAGLVIGYPKPFRRVWTTATRIY